MPESGTSSLAIEDVLSSIRRLVAEDNGAKSRRRAPVGPDDGAAAGQSPTAPDAAAAPKLVLTQEQRVSEPSDPWVPVTSQAGAEAEAAIALAIRSNPRSPAAEMPADTISHANTRSEMAELLASAQAAGASPTDAESIDAVDDDTPPAEELAAAPQDEAVVADATPSVPDPADVLDTADSGVSELRVPIPADPGAVGDRFEAAVAGVKTAVAASSFSSLPQTRFDPIADVVSAPRAALSELMDEADLTRAGLAPAPTRPRPNEANEGDHTSEPNDLPDPKLAAPANVTPLPAPPEPIAPEGPVDMDLANGLIEGFAAEPDDAADAAMMAVAIVAEAEDAETRPREEGDLHGSWATRDAAEAQEEDHYLAQTAFDAAVLADTAAFDIPATVAAVDREAEAVRSEAAAAHAPRTIMQGAEDRIPGRAEAPISDATAAEADRDEVGDDFDFDDGEGLILDEDTLREIVADVVREELQGVLGQRITRNVRKMVRREIRLALAAEEFD